MIKFSTTLLERQEIDLVGEEPPAFIGIPDSDMITFPAPVKYALHVSLGRRGILVAGKVMTEVDALCGRCLQPVRLSVANHDVFLFVEPPKTDECDISEQIRTELLVCLPMNYLCDDECLGLCPECGVDRNTTQCQCSDNSGAENPWSVLDKL